jgi:hypothetical protein
MRGGEMSYNGWYTLRLLMLFVFIGWLVTVC